MDSQLCRLCLQRSDDVLSIWETFQDSTIATVLVKHFLFLQVNDGLTEWLCQVCWIQTRSFHEFYQQVEDFQNLYQDSTKNDCCDNDVKDVADISDTGCDLTIEETKVKLEPVESQVTQEDDKSQPIDETPQIDSDGQPVLRMQGTSFSESDYEINKKIKEEQNRELNGKIKEFYTMECDLCNAKNFDTLLEIKRHYRKMHQTWGYLKCCDKKLQTRTELLDHIRHHIVNSESAEKDDEIYKHFTMKCDICENVAFKSMMDMRRHYRIHNVHGYVICSCCDKKFDTRHSMVAHIRAQTNPDAYHCEQCDKSFTTNRALKGHIENHVPLDSRAFKCNLCSSSFARESRLKAHIKDTHTSKTGQKFPCEKCNKYYSSALLLKCHVRQCHETLPDYVCELCARKFKSKHNLRYHFTSEHSTEPEPRLQCDICTTWLKNKRSLIRHMKEQHQSNEKINCHICSKTFPKYRLRNHISYVHGERRHRCTLCVKTFHFRSELKEHVATHTGEDLYKCRCCDKKFKSNANFWAHMKKSHYTEWLRNSKKATNGEN